MFNTIVEAGAVGAGAALRYGSGSDQKMRLRLRLRNTDFYTNKRNRVTSATIANYRHAYSGYEFYKSILLHILAKGKYTPKGIDKRVF
jgi:hypothetical protein